MVDDETTGRQWLPPEDPDEVRAGMQRLGEWMRNLPEDCDFGFWIGDPTPADKRAALAMHEARRAGRDVIAAGLAAGSPQPEVGDLDRDDLRGAVDQRE